MVVEGRIYRSHFQGERLQKGEKREIDRNWFCIDLLHNVRVSTTMQAICSDLEQTLLSKYKVIVLGTKYNDIHPVKGLQYYTDRI